MAQRTDTTEIYNDDDRQYLQMMQENIARMAGNSASCKTWLVTLVAAMLTTGIAVQALSHWMLFSLFPIIMLWQLDVYYLKLERGLCNRQRLFINIINAIDFDVAEYKKALFNFKTFKCVEDDDEKGLKATENLDFTESVSPFYPILMGLSIAVSLILLMVR